MIYSCMTSKQCRWRTQRSLPSYALRWTSTTKLRKRQRRRQEEDLLVSKMGLELAKLHQRVHRLQLKHRARWT